MDISAEKAEIMKRFNLVHDIDLIETIKNLLDFGLRKQNDEDYHTNTIALDASINRGIDELGRGLGIPHDEVMAKIRKRYDL